MPASRRSWVRIRAYLLSSLCATLAGLMSVAQDKGVTPHSGLSAELIVIAAVIIGGASILGGRGRVLGSCLGAMLVVLIDKVLREGWPITRIIKIGDEEIAVKAISSLPAGAVPAFLGAAAAHRRADRALAHPPPGRRRASGPGCAASRRRRAYEIGGVAIEGVQTKGAMATDMALSATRPRQVPRPARRARHHPDRGAVAGRPLRSGPTTGGTCRTASRSCSTTPSWR